MTVEETVSFLDDSIPDKTIGLPDEIFYFISRTTPLVNVDLLVKDEKGRVLLSWRNDKYYGQGWHIPGGIVRFKETLEQRIQRTAKQELGTEVYSDSTPLTIEQFIVPEWENRAHFISFLYECFVPEDFIPNNLSKKRYDAGYIEWHDECPVNFIPFQAKYVKFIQHDIRARS
jgi:colanic acid biosynthesis protein WcaH